MAPKIAPVPFPATMPGSILKMMLKGHSLTQAELATRLKLGQPFIDELCRGKRPITADLAQKLGKFFHQSPEFWMKLQRTWDEAAAALKAGELQEKA